MVEENSVRATEPETRSVEGRGADGGPLVSVVLPAYNHERFVEQAIRSIWEQTYPNVELIVLDDGSSDGTPEVIERLLPLSPIPVRFVRKQNEGVARTLNRGLELVRGEWITFVSSDDFFAPRRIAEQVALGIRLGPDFGCIHSDAYMVDEQGTITGTAYARSSLPPAEGNCLADLATGRCDIIGSTVMIRAECFAQIGGYDESLTSEDFDLHLRLAAVTRFAFVDQPLTHLRHLPGSLGRSPEVWIDEGYRVLEKHRAALKDQYPEALRKKSLRNFGVSLYNGYPAGVVRYGLRALRESRSWNAAAHTLQSLSVTLVGYTFKRVFHRVLPEGVERGLRRLFRRQIIT